MPALWRHYCCIQFVLVHARQNSDFLVVERHHEMINNLNNNVSFTTTPALLCNSKKLLNIISVSHIYIYKVCFINMWDLLVGRPYLYTVFPKNGRIEKPTPTTNVVSVSKKLPEKYVCNTVITELPSSSLVIVPSCLLFFNMLLVHFLGPYTPHAFAIFF